MKLLTLIASVFLLMSCGTSETKNEIKSTDTIVEKTKPVVKSNWVYDFKVDEMTEDTIFFASNESTDKHNFKMPYSGGSSMTISIVHRNKKNEILLNISKGQFIISVMDEEIVKIRFDDKEAFNVSYSMGTTGMLDVVFLTSVEKLIKEMKTSSKMKIQAGFSFEGAKVFNFDVSGLDWNH